MLLDYMHPSCDDVRWRNAYIVRHCGIHEATTDLMVSQKEDHLLVSHCWPWVNETMGKGGTKENIQSVSSLLKLPLLQGKLKIPLSSFQGCPSYHPTALKFLALSFTSLPAFSCLIDTSCEFTVLLWLTHSLRLHGKSTSRAREAGLGLSRQVTFSLSELDKGSFILLALES